MRAHMILRGTALGGAAALGLILLSGPALAAGSLSGAQSVLQSIVDVLTGDIARLVAIIACVVIGFTFMFGYVDLRTVGYFIVGVIILFGATEIVDLLKK
jgi:type IV secretory pathway VirB2 component (pilin)